MIRTYLYIRNFVSLQIAEFLIEGMLILYFCCLIRNKIWPPKEEEIEMNEKSK